jgi:hypothetical protein
MASLSQNGAMKFNKYAPIQVDLRKLSLSILLGVVGLIGANSAFAMSQLAGLTIEPEWPTNTQPGNVIVYKITSIDREGAGLLRVALSASGLPEGSIVSFSPSVARFTGRAVKSQTAYLIITTPQVMSLEDYPFTITATAQRSSITVSNQNTRANVGPGGMSLLLDLASETNLRLRGKGASGGTYQIESATDLSNPVWTPVGKTTADGNGRFTFFSEIDKTAPTCFFRASLVEN